MGVETPNLRRLATVATVLGERQTRVARLAAAKCPAEARSEAVVRAVQIRELTRRENEITTRLDEKLSDADCVCLPVTVIAITGESSLVGVLRVYTS